MRLLKLFKNNLGVVIAESLEFRVIVTGHGRAVHIKHLGHKLIVRSNRLVDANNAALTAHSIDLAHGLGHKFRADLGQLWVEQRIHLAGSVTVPHGHIGHRHESRCKAPGRGYAALHGVGHHVHIVGRRLVIFGKHSGVNQPFAEILAHHGLQHAAARCQLAFGRAPVGPAVGSHAPQVAFAVGKWRTDVMTAQHHRFLQLILVLELTAALRLCQSDLRHACRQNHQNCRNNTFHGIY
ncbi:hypothetical protein IMSAGC006_02196 [Muribaculaceae bacterium]|nr:hypothetical protein IMSAGC006_02196 [Muribaculaceae bacterium]